VAIVGRPNVGKSSLFNSLLGTDRAIVTDIAGTTRDQLHEKFTIDDIPISLVDTAGLRETTDAVERIGVERARRTIADVDLVIAMVDVSENETSEDVDILTSIKDSRHIIVLNKIDKVDRARLEAFHAQLQRELNFDATHVLKISAKTGEGLDRLKRTMIEPFASHDSTSNGFLVSDARHYDLLVRAGDEIAQSIEQLRHGQSEEITLIGLHNALRYLGEITGETTTEDVLTRIFSTFCIGK
jgi:tRNA modification GTPase